MADPVCILGHGVAALALLREYRRLAPSAPVLVLSDTDGNYCYKPRLTAAFSRGLLPSELVTEAAMSWTARLDARLLCTPEAPVVDTRRRTLRVGADTIRYRALVLAVGAQGRVPELAEACVPLLRIDTWQEWRHAHPQLSRAQHVAVVGAGLVGCELADDLARAGKEVELVDNGPWPLHGKVPAEIGTLLARTLSHYGVHFHRQRRLHALRSARAGHLRLDLGDGRGVAADAVVSAVGVSPNLAPARALGVACRTGVCVDATLATSVPRVFALGDVAEVDGVWQATVASAKAQAQVLAARLAGEDARLRPVRHPVKVKTELCPIVYSSRPGPALKWQLTERTRRGIAALQLDPAGRPVGFALQGQAASSYRVAELAALCSQPEAAAAAHATG